MSDTLPYAVELSENEYLGFPDLIKGAYVNVFSFRLPAFIPYLNVQNLLPNREYDVAFRNLYCENFRGLPLLTYSGNTPVAPTSRYFSEGPGNATPYYTQTSVFHFFSDSDGNFRGTPIRKNGQSGVGLPYNNNHDGYILNSSSSDVYCNGWKLRNPDPFDYHPCINDPTNLYASTLENDGEPYTLKTQNYGDRQVFTLKTKIRYEYAIGSVGPSNSQQIYIIPDSRDIILHSDIGSARVVDNYYPSNSYLREGIGNLSIPNPTEATQETFLCPIQSSRDAYRPEPLNTESVIEDLEASEIPDPNTPIDPPAATQVAPLDPIGVSPDPVVGDLTPTYGTSIKFSADGVVIPMAHKYFSTAINGTNSLTATLDLKFEGDKEDIDFIYEKYRQSDGTSLLSLRNVLPNFYKEFLFQAREFSSSGGEGNLINATLLGDATLDSSALSVSGQHIFMYDDGLDEFGDRVKVIDTESSPLVFSTLKLEAYQVVYYKQYDHRLNNFRSPHSFWNKVFFVGDEYLKYCEDNGHDYATYINSEELFLQHMTQSLPKHFDKSLTISAPSSAEEIKFKGSFKVRTKASANQVGMSGISLVWENLNDSEAFALTAFCEARLANRSTKSPLPKPYHRVGEYIVTDWTHTFVDCNINKMEIRIQPKFNSYTPV